MNPTHTVTMLIFQTIEAEIGVDGVLRPIRTIGKPRTELLVKIETKPKNGESKIIWELPFTRPLIPI